MDGCSGFLFYVYTWAYPDGEVFYVGMGTGNRYKARHEQNRYVRTVAKSIEARGQEVQRTIVAWFKVRQHAAVYERMLIETFGMEHLTNLVNEDGPRHRRLDKPLEIQTIELPNMVYRRNEDKLKYAGMTRQPWEDDGSAI